MSAWCVGRRKPRADRSPQRRSDTEEGTGEWEVTLCHARAGGQVLAGGVRRLGGCFCCEFGGRAWRRRSGTLHNVRSAGVGRVWGEQRRHRRVETRIRGRVRGVMGLRDGSAGRDGVAALAQVATSLAAAMAIHMARDNTGRVSLYPASPRRSRLGVCNSTGKETRVQELRAVWVLTRWIGRRRCVPGVRRGAGAGCTVKSGARRPTWRGMVVVWVVATAVLMVVALPASKVGYAICYADFSAFGEGGWVLFGCHVPWTPEFGTAPSCDIFVPGNPMRLGGAPRFGGGPVLGSGFEAYQLTLPLWLIAVLGGGTTALVCRVVKRRRVRGVCACGYSLVGLGERAVCPECGRKSTA